MTVDAIARAHRSIASAEMKARAAGEDRLALALFVLLRHVGVVHLR